MHLLLVIPDARREISRRRRESRKNFVPFTRYNQLIRDVEKRGTAGMRTLPRVAGPYGRGVEKSLHL